MTEAEYRSILGQMRVFVTMAASIDSDRLQMARRTAENADTLAPFFDPTAWMQKGHLLRQEIAAMGALLEFKRKISEAVARNQR